jgi:hypothetical protein
MRAHHVIAVVAVILVGIAVKLITAPTAGADSLSIESGGLDVFQLHQDARNLPTQKFHNMALVFPGDA